MERTYYAGQIVEKQELIELEDGKGEVLNLSLETELTNDVLGITEVIPQRIVAFKSDALRADDSLKEGDFIICTECQRSPRTYLTKKQATAKVVDLVLRRFVKVAEEDFPAMLEKIKDRMFTMEDLQFTAADGRELARAEAAAEAANADGDILQA